MPIHPRDVEKFQWITEKSDLLVIAEVDSSSWTVGICNDFCGNRAKPVAVQIRRSVVSVVIVCFGSGC